MLPVDPLRLRRRFIAPGGAGRTLFRLLLLTAAVALGCAERPAEQIPEPGPIATAWLDLPAPDRPWNLILITMDTTRRDRLGCYGHPGGLTPRLDELARRGILFENAITPVPITLPAHASLMTGQDPQLHGVRNNTTFRLPPEARTLAEVLHEQGYVTGATLGAAPVESGFGLEQGFEEYDDDFLRGGTIHADRQPQRPAAEVTQRALEWIMARRDRGILCVADHGESLGEHGEETHAYLIYGATQWIPCILVPPGDFDGLPAEVCRGRRVEAIVTLSDFAPTLLNALGLPREPLGAGISLMSMIAGEESTARALYTETLAPHLEMGWSALHGVRTERWSYIRAPRPELYDLAADPAESNNLHARRPAVARRMAAWCDHYVGQDQGYQPHVPSAGSLERLRSLGYLGAAALPARQAPSDKDPKDRMDLLARIMAVNALMESDPAAAIYLLNTLARDDPENPMVLRFQARAHMGRKEVEGTRAACEALLARMPDDIEARSHLAWSLMMSGEDQAAESLLAGVLGEDPRRIDARSHLAVLYSRRGHLDRARALLEETVALHPAVAEPVTHLALFEWDHGDRTRAQRLADEALSYHAGQPQAWMIRGQSLLEESAQQAAAGLGSEAVAGRARAVECFERALELDPDQAAATQRLAAAAAAAGDREGAIRLYECVLARGPAVVELHVALGDLLRQEQEYGPAGEHYRAAFSLGCREPRFLSNYGVLQVLLDDRPRARELWELALAQNPTAGLAAGIRLNLERLETP